MSTTPLLNSKAGPSFVAPQGRQFSTWRSYFELTRLHKFPTGTMVLFWPCALGLALGAHHINMPTREFTVQMILYFIGSTIVHSAACVINDICDREFDRQVERTKNRPLVTGAISVTGATLLLIAMTASALALLSLTNELAFKIGLLGVFPLHALYPLMKRWTYWPQAWLGLTMNWGLPVAWVAVTGYIDWKLLPATLLGTWAWTMVYDTIYGCQDRRDDVKAGVKSTSLLFGSHVRSILSLFALIFVGSLAYAGVNTHQPLAYYVLSVGGVAVHLTWQLGTLNVDEPADCWKKFNSNGSLGYLMLAGFAVQYLPDDLLQWGF